MNFTPHYQIVFDITGATYPNRSAELAQVILFGVVPVGFFALYLYGRLAGWRSFVRPGNYMLRICTLVAIFFGAGLVSVYSAIHNHHRFAELQAAARTGQYLSVNGVVTRYSPPGRRRAASFYVNNLMFRLQADSLQTGFRDHRLISNGLPVSINYVASSWYDNDIIRLEIAE